MVYICEFGGGCKQLREHFDHQWKIRRNRLIPNRINDPRRWARYGQDVINKIDKTQYGIEKSDPTLVCLFRKT